MKKIHTLLLINMLLVCVLPIIAQNNVGIGTNTPDASAKIDISSTDKGLLIPRIALSSTTDAATIPNPATALLVYNTATAGTSPNNVTPGFYYNAGTAGVPVWTRLQTGSSNTDWNLNGNAGTNQPAVPAVYGTSAIGNTENWIGTRDAKDLVLGTNNKEGMRILQSNGNIGIGTATPAKKLEVANSDVLVYNLIVGRGGGGRYENTALGSSALAANTSGDQNTAIGYHTLINNQTGRNNTSTGFEALVSNTSSYNTAFGSGALQNTATGLANDGFGFGAGNVNTTGNYNTYFGHFANPASNNLSNTTVIGANALVRSSNSLILGDTINGIRVGIGTTDPNSSAVLDMVSSNKGIRIPNVALSSTTDAVTIPTPATSLLIYNTASAGTAPNNVIPGYYYNTNTSASPIWTRFNTSAIADTLGWTKALTTSTKAITSDNQYVKGNVGIGDFSGSTPSDKLHIMGSMRVDAGRIGVYNTGRSVYIGRESGINDNFSTNLENVAMGLQTLLNNSAGNKNVAIGTFAMLLNTASSNVAVGHYGMVNNTTGTQNVALGTDALKGNSTGSNNVGIGQSALSVNITGSNNTALGYQANTGSNALTNATAIGSFATVRSNNSLVLGDTINGIRVGIGTTSPNTSTALDIVSSNKGIRIPNVTLTGTTDTTTIVSPAASLLVYNTATAGTAPNNVIPGYYYNSNTSALPVWTRLNTSATADTLGWTKALTTSTKATRSDDQYVTGKVGIGNFSASSPKTNLQVIGNGSVGARNLNVTGVNAFAVGDTNTVTGKNSFSVGQANTNAAESSIAGGYVSRIESGYGYSIALGFMDTVAASAAACFGYSNKITAIGGLTGGMNNKVTAPYSAAFGINNVISATSGLSLGSKNNTSGDNSISLGYTNFNGGENSIAAGYFTRIENSYDNSIVSGMTDTVAAALSAVFGWGNKTTGGASLICGERNKVTAYAGTALGRFNNADGEASFSSGIYTTAPSMAETSIGVYSTNYTPAGGSSVFAPTDRLFNVGNGTSISGRADAFTILKNGNIGIGTASPAYNITFANGANKTIGADRSATAATPYNLTIQASGALSGSTNNQGGDLVLSSGISTGSGVNGGDGVSDPGSSIVFKTSGTVSPSSGTFDLAPDEKMRIRGDGTVKINSLAGTGNRKVYATATGNLSAREDLAYFDGRGNTYSQDNSNSGYRTIGSATNSITVNTGDVVAISVTSKFRWTGGSGTDHPYYGVRISGAASTDLTDSEKLGYADDFPRGQWMPQSGQYIWVSNTNGSIQLQVIVDNNSDADDPSEYKDVVITGTVH